MAETYTETCCACGIEFCMSKDHNDMLRRTKKSFYCPSGHQQSYMGESFEKKEKRLQEKIANQEKTIEDLREFINHVEGRVVRLRAQINRLKIARGRWRGIATRLREVSDD